MNDLCFTFLSKLPSMICFVAAAGLCYKAAPGWGWFLVAGVLVHTVVEFRK